MRTNSWRLAGCALALVASGCSDSAPSTPTSPTAPTTPPTASPPVTLEATVTITANNRFQPVEVRVLRGGRVTFINQNNRAHDITSDPPHLHTDCPSIIEVGFIQPGQTKQTGVLNDVRTCGFHDHMQENNPDLQGRIIIQGTSE